MIGSPQQEMVWQAMSGTDGNVVVEARAGTGKTFTALHGMSLLNTTDVAFMAYNKAIAEELQQKVPVGVTACTTHSHGLKAIRDAGMAGKISGRKTWNIIEDIYGGKEKAKKEDQVKLMAIEKLAGMIKNTLSGELAQGVFSIGGGEMMQLIDRYSIDCSGKQDEVMDQACLVIQQSVELFERTKQLDFDDMIWLPIVMGYRIPKYEVLIVDEAQDLNKMCQACIIRLVVQDGRVMIVGDRSLAI